VEPTSHLDVNHLRRGATYCAIAHGVMTTGEYLGIESPYGDSSILLRATGGTRSIALCALTAIDEVV
jgi:hypothetical protein